MPCSPDTRGSLGSQTVFLVEDSVTAEPCVPATFDSSSERYEILAESIRYTDALVGGNGLTGTIDKTKNHLRHGVRVVTGQFSMEVGPYEVAAWKNRIQGGASVATNFEPTPFDIMIKRDKGTVIYRHCVVRAAVFSCVSSGGQEQVLRMTLDILGFEEHDADSDFPATPPTIPTNDRLYWLIGDSLMTLTPDGGSAGDLQFDQFSLRIDNGVVPLVRNNLMVTALQSRGREVTLRASTPYSSSSHSSYYIDYFKGGGNITFSHEKSNGEVPSLYDTVFTLNNLRSVRVSPSVTGPGEIPLFIDMTAHRSGTTAPYSIVSTYA